MMNQRILSTLMVGVSKCNVNGDSTGGGNDGDRCALENESAIANIRFANKFKLIRVSLGIMCRIVLRLPPPVLTPPALDLCMLLSTARELEEFVGIEVSEVAKKMGIAGPILGYRVIAFEKTNRATRGKLRMSCQWTRSLH